MEWKTFKNLTIKKLRNGKLTFQNIQMEFRKEEQETIDKGGYIYRRSSVEWKIV